MPEEPDDDLESLSEVDLVRRWHESTNCSGKLSYQDTGWECTLDLMCPMLQLVMQIHSERN